MIKNDLKKYIGVSKFDLTLQEISNVENLLKNNPDYDFCDDCGELLHKNDLQCRGDKELPTKIFEYLENLDISCVCFDCLFEDFIEECIVCGKYFKIDNMISKKHAESYSSIGVVSRFCDALEDSWMCLDCEKIITQKEMSLKIFYLIENDYVVAYYLSSIKENLIYLGRSKYENIFDINNLIFLMAYNKGLIDADLYKKYNGDYLLFSCDNEIINIKKIED